MKPAIFEMSPDTRLIRQHLEKMVVGDFVSYLDLSGLVSKPISGASSSLQSAVRSLLNNDGIVFSVIRGEGLKRLNDHEIVAASDGDIDGVRRRAKKAARKITCVREYAKLSPKAQIDHTIKLSIFTSVASMASDKGMKALSAVASGRSSELPIAETMKAFMQGIV